MINKFELFMENHKKPLELNELNYLNSICFAKDKPMS